ncbi:MAG: hypothetical protein QNJ72_44425 [Pleurocapsa sp. MO_226.B13]|nr:hypothetical protein [Pleurocapsa sp. MO_226.B13]
MKKTDNIFRYISYGLIAIGIGAIALNPGSSQATKNTTETSSTFKTNSSTRKRHKININVSSLEDIKVAEGDRVEVNSLISDRTSERTKLLAKKQRLAASLTRARLPLRELKPVPEPKFQKELAALKQAQFNLDAIARQIDNFDPMFYHKDPWHVQVFESEKVQELAELKRRELAASINVERAIAALDEAKLNYQKQQYEHSLKVSDYQTLMQKQQEQINSLQTQIDKVDEELEQLTSVYSPYRGKVRRVKILGQNERSITAEVTLDIRGGK